GSSAKLKPLSPGCCSCSTPPHVADQINVRRCNLGRVHIGAVMYVCRIDGMAVGKLLSREQSADEYFSECYRSGGPQHDNKGGENVWIDLDKSWFAIHSLLTEGREDTALPTGALLGGTTVGRDCAWLVLSVEQTASFAACLATKPDDMVERSPRFAAAVPPAWNNA